MTLLSLAVFFASGVAALLYQVIWQRLLVIFSGADLYSATLVVAAFMAGLGLGSLAGGHLADRVSSRTSLLLFCLAELAVAVFGAISDTLYHELLYQRLGHIDLAPPLLAGILFLSLLWPTSFMGASLPLLARALTGRIDRAATTIGSLYGFNTLGAAVGALIATWWLLPQVGMEGGLRVGVVLNIACGVVLLPFAWLHRPVTVDTGAASRSTSADEERGRRDANRFPLWGWAAIYAFSGFLALSLEIVWFRLLGVMMKSTAFTFGTLLGLYLAGLAAGALGGSALAARVRRPAVAFLLLQAGVGLCAGGLLLGVLALGRENGTLYEYFGSYEPLDAREHAARLGTILSGLLPEDGTAGTRLFLALYVGLPLLLVFLPTLLMGCSFPLLQRIVQTDLTKLGRRVGLLLLANIAGSLAGAVVTGWLLLDVAGTAATFRILVGVSAAFALLAAALIAKGMRVPASARFAFSGSTALTMVAFVPVVVAMPDTHTLWSRLHGTTPLASVLHEDGSGVSLIKVGQSARMVVFVNGLGQSTLPYGNIHTALGAVPAFVHGAPRTAVIIGLGSGDTVHSVGGHPTIERIASVEIVRPQLRTLRALNSWFEYPGLAVMLRDTRVEHIFGDGRAFLMRGNATYDLIEADALRPTSAFSGMIYSEEYFRLVRRHLSPHGLAASWNASRRVHDTFLRVFPHVVVLRDILIGSDRPIIINRAAIDARLAEPAVRQYYGGAGTDIAHLITYYLDDYKTFGPDHPREQLTDINTDLHPRDEFQLGAQ